ncbi:hypothetical protein B0H14DRAFT_3704899 [Mycena olivaceomarginata]|nr:hypothetical protein B0H14DRAFT_3704899 [Mycena olivaceomarginata]
MISCIGAPENSDASSRDCDREIGNTQFSLDNASSTVLLTGVMRIVDQDSWWNRRRDKCTCSQITLFACSDCDVPDLCSICMVQAHWGSPFHSIREWSERFSYYIRRRCGRLDLHVGVSHGGELVPAPAPSGWKPSQSPGSRRERRQSDQGTSLVMFAATRDSKTPSRLHESTLSRVVSSHGCDFVRLASRTKSTCPDFK